MSQRADDVRIDLLDNERDLEEFWECMYQSFGVQTQDAFCMLLYPQMSTKEGYAAAIKSLQTEWLEEGKTSKVKFWLKATVPDTKQNEQSESESKSDSSGRKVIGGAIWLEALHSRNPASNDATKSMDVAAMYPGDEPTQRFLKQSYASLYANRVKVVEEAGREDRPVMVLELCLVHPEYQGLRVGRKLVQWGLDLASKKGESYGDGGTLECYTEGSVMGRPVYEKMGFQFQGEVVYEVDDEFKDRRTAPNAMLRRPQGLPV